MKVKKVRRTALGRRIRYVLFLYVFLGFLPLNKNNDIDKPQLDVLDYKGLTIKIVIKSTKGAKT